MAVYSSEQDFVLTIVDIFTLTGRGTAVIGPVESGVLRTAEEVEVWDDQHLVTTARATFELINMREADPRSVCLLLGGVDKTLLSPGQLVRSAARRE
ncbi:MAG: hypothetical protein ACRYG2_15220 [Janthinobacterium lividum]